MSNKVTNMFVLTYTISKSLWLTHNMSVYTMPYHLVDHYNYCDATGTIMSLSQKKKSTESSFEDKQYYTHW